MQRRGIAAPPYLYLAGGEKNRLDTQLIVLSGLAASLAALLIAWLTVGLMAAKAASAKPVLALRNE
jgi:hypothetical protein